jgi:hypothetical protein
MRAMSDPRPIGTDDYVSIQRLVHRYADAVVHRRGDQWASTWADDAAWDLGGGRLVEGKAAIVDLWYRAMQGMHAVFQTVHNGEVWIDPLDADRATGRWYISERFRRSTGENAILLAHYDDSYVRVGGQWLFARRFLEIHYSGPPDLIADFSCTLDRLQARGVPADV